jgi:hypothetical protein
MTFGAMGAPDKLNLLVLPILLGEGGRRSPPLSVGTGQVHEDCRSLPEGARARARGHAHDELARAPISSAARAGRAPEQLTGSPPVERIRPSIVYSFAGESCEGTSSREA